MQPRNKFLLLCLFLSSCSGETDSGNIDILQPSINMQIKSFIKSARFYSPIKSNFFSVIFYNNQDKYRVQFDNIKPSLCDNFIGYVKYDSAIVYIYGGKDVEAYFKIKKRIPCENILSYDNKRIPKKIDWYSDVFLFDGKSFTHVPPN